MDILFKLFALLPVLIVLYLLVRDTIRIKKSNLLPKKKVFIFNDRARTVTIFPSKGRDQIRKIFKISMDTENVLYIYTDFVNLPTALKYGFLKRIESTEILNVSLVDMNKIIIETLNQRIEIETPKAKELYSLIAEKHPQ